MSLIKAFEGLEECFIIVKLREAFEGLEQTGNGLSALPVLLEDWR